MAASAPTEEQLALGRAFEQVVAWLRRTRTTSDISATGLSLLDRLDLAGAQRITDLAAGEGVSQPAMTSLVNRLEGLGWARRSSDPADGRAILVDLTAAGRDRLLRHRAERSRRLADRLAQLDESDQQALLAALPALTRLAALPDSPLHATTGGPRHA
jgi:DNA-binding MarR family transcriptional regulator